jgi:hypothetical protein
VWDSVTPLSAIRDLLASLTGVQSAQIGAPEAATTRVGAYVTVGADSTADQRTGVQRGELAYFCALYYRVSGAEEAAEVALATALDDLKNKWITQRPLGTGLFNPSVTHVKNVRMDFNLAANPEYVPLAGQELRIYPFTIFCTQEATFST